ncbi:MAG: hypothetical protein Tsb0021_00930 [Chlamydiales bacterium]
MTFFCVTGFNQTEHSRFIIDYYEKKEIAERVAKQAKKIFQKVEIQSLTLEQVKNIKAIYLKTQGEGRVSFLISNKANSIYILEKQI